MWIDFETHCSQIMGEIYKEKSNKVRRWSVTLYLYVNKYSDSCTRIQSLCYTDFSI